MSSLLAIHGAEQTVPPERIKPWPHITDADREAVLAVLSTGDINEMRKEQSETLEREWAEYVGVKYCIATNSGTAALHLAVAGVGVQPGDEVICPAFTYWATAAAVLHHNGIPVFVDIDPETFCIDTTKIEAAVTEKTVAILPVHIHGMPADMDPILEIAQDHGLKVIEDCAQAHGAIYKGHRVGGIGDAAGFSTQMSKNLTAGSEGGLFVTDDELIWKRARLLQYLGELVVPGRERAQEYNAYGLGWMYRGDVFGQAFARSQLTRLDLHNERRIRNCQYLSRKLKKIPGLQIPFVPEYAQPVHFEYVIGLDPDALGLDVDATTLRDKVMAALEAEGVRVCHWQRMAVPAQEIFQTREGYGKGCPWKCPNSRDVVYRREDYAATERFISTHFYVRGITYPNDTDLMDLYIEAFRKVMGNVGELL